jgi:hypothetical protein
MEAFRLDIGLDQGDVPSTILQRPDALTRISRASSLAGAMSFTSWLLMQRWAQEDARRKEFDRLLAAAYRARNSCDKAGLHKQEEIA